MSDGDTITVQLTRTEYQRLLARLTAAEGLLREAEDQLSDWWNCMGDGTGKGPFPGLLGDTATLVPKLRAFLAAPPGRREAGPGVDGAEWLAAQQLASSRRVEGMAVALCWCGRNCHAASNHSTTYGRAPIPRPAPALIPCNCLMAVCHCGGFREPPAPAPETCGTCGCAGGDGFLITNDDGSPCLDRPCPACRPATPGDGRERP